MSDTTEEVYTRLSTTIEAWDHQITESHDALSQQIRTVRTHLTRLLEPTDPSTAPPEVPDDGTAVTIASLEAEVAQLTEALKRARNAAPPLVGGPPPEEIDGVNETVTQLEADLAEAKEASITLQAALDARDIELEELRVGLADAVAKQEEDQANAAALTALQEATDTLQTALIAAETRVTELEGELADQQASADEAMTTATEALAARLETATQECSAALARCAELESALEGATAAASAAGEANAALETLQQDHDHARARIAELETLLADAEAKATKEEAPEASDDVAESESALNAVQQDYAAALARIDALELQLAQQQELQTTSSKEIDGSISIKAFDSQGHKKRMGEILMELGVLDEGQLKKILKEQSAEPQQRLGALVVSHGFTGEDIVAKILAAQLRLPYCDIRDMEIDAEAAALVSPHVAQLHRCMPVSEDNGALTVAMVNPLDLIAIEDLELASRCQVVPMVSTPSQIDARLRDFYGEPL